MPWRSLRAGSLYYGSGFTDGSSDVPAHLEPHTTFDLSLGKSIAERSPFRSPPSTWAIGASCSTTASPSAAPITPSPARSTSRSDIVSTCNVKQPVFAGCFLQNVEQPVYAGCFFPYNDRMTRAAVFLITPLLLAATTYAQAPPVTVLRPARVFDGTTMHEGWAVRIKADKIEAAGPAATIDSTSPASSISPTQL